MTASGWRRRMAAAWLVLLATAAAAQLSDYETFEPGEDETGRLLSRTFERCMDAHGASDLGARDCSRAETARLAPQLAPALEAAVARAPNPAARERLRADQQAWQTGLTAFCEPSFDPPTNDAVAIAAARETCRLQETTRRLLWLGGGERPGPPSPEGAERIPFEEYRPGARESDALLSRMYESCMAERGFRSDGPRACVDGEIALLRPRLEAAQRAASDRLASPDARRRLAEDQVRWTSTLRERCDAQAAVETAAMAPLVSDGCRLDETLRRILWLQHHGAGFR